MGTGAMRVPAVVAVATAAATAGLLPILWALPQEVPSAVGVGLVIVAYAANAAVILVARPGTRVGRTMLLGTAAWAAGELLLAWGVAGWARSDPVVAGAPEAAVLGTGLRGAGWLVLVLGVPLTFPDGRTAWPQRRWPGVLLGLSIGVFALGTLLAPAPLESRIGHLRNPLGLSSVLSPVADLLALAGLALAAVTLAVAVLGLRVRWRQADELGRQQLVWFGVAFALPLLCLPLAATPWASPLLFAAVTAPAPVALAVALLQRRLYDIELVTSRSITYVLVSVIAVCVYAGTVAVVGVVLHRPGAQWLPWVGAAVIALVFTPLRVAVQAFANRVTYGHWAAPVEVLAETERRLRDATDLRALIDTLVGDVARLLRLPHLEVRDERGRVVSQASSPEVLSGADARTGPRGDPEEELVLTAYGITVGTLSWTGAPLRSSDRRLLEGVGRQLGEALHAAALTEQVQAAHERLVLAREEERKRLRRDLHDGLGPSLAALGLEVERLRNRVPVLDAEQTDEDLVRLRDGIQRTVAEVRRVVEGLRPPVLDELGLGAAVDQLTDRLTRAAWRADTQVEATVEVADLPVLPAATEVAAFRIVQEALTNVVHHAGAGRVHVSLAASGRDLVVVVSDDGSGQVEPRSGGVGLSTMRERAEELGGRLEVLAVPGDGTTVTARLPLPVGSGTELVDRSPS